MSNLYSVPIAKWVAILKNVTASYDVFAPIRKNDFLDYELINDENIDLISYGIAKPSTPLKAFFFPIKENVVRKKENEKKRIILGVPSCDLNALNLLDKIFLENDFLDIYYKYNRENAIIIASDCMEIDDNCHCTSYGGNPFPEKNCDLALVYLDDTVYLHPMSEKGEEFFREINTSDFAECSQLPDEILRIREKNTAKLISNNSELPDAEKTKKLILNSNDEIWKKYAQKCVSCGACAVICPTCHCFLLIDKEKFEKIKNWDSCQYPAFERVAAGEDPLKKIYQRLKNRYECKFVHKPKMFDEIACTGCGRCIDACIGKIDKNEIIIELAKTN